MKSNVKYGFRIVSVNEEERTAVIVLVQKQPGQMNKSGTLDVNLSGLLLKNIQAGRVEIGKYYESEDQSVEYYDNPMQLLKYVKDENSTALLLAMVFEAKTEWRKEELPMGGVREYPIFHKHAKSDWKRWRNCVPKNFTPANNSKTK